MTVFVCGVQSRQLYLTANNRLRQSIGASRLIAASLDDWQENPGKIYIGGGNAALRFTSVEEGRAQVSSWSRKWLREAPGLRLVAAHASDADEFEAWKNARKKLAEIEDWNFTGAELGALPVTRTCPDTHLAASALHNGEWKSAEAVKKECAVKAESYAGFRLPLDFEDFGMSEGMRQIAIVHADGDGVGKTFEQVKSIQELRTYSDKLTIASDAAWERLMSGFVSGLPSWTRPPQSDAPSGWLKSRDSAVPYLPVRRLVNAGDDATWICPARLGLSSAVAYCQGFEQASRENGMELSASAGVVIVPNGFPYRRAYELAAELASNAKRARRERGSGSGYVDFQLVLEGSTRSVKQLRARYRHELLRRPYEIGKGTDEFRDIWRYFKDHWKRGRAKLLLEKMASSQNQGRETAQLFAEQGYSLPDSCLADPDNCFDALEFLDFYEEWPNGGVDATQN